jgi:hypothetical protein
MYAHYYSRIIEGKARHYLIISMDMIPHGLEYTVGNKADARRIAKAQNLICWNF